MLRRSFLGGGFGVALGVLGAASAWAQADEPPPAERARTASESVQPAAEIDIEMPTYSDMERVESAANAGQARGREALEDLIAERALRPAPLDQDSAAPKDRPTLTEPPPRVDGRLVLAVSSSMPETMLHDYMAQLDGSREAIIVLRGFVGGGREVKPTLRFLERLRRVDPDVPMKDYYDVSVVVDPIVFASLGIEQVPAVAWLDGVQELAHCDAQDFSAPVIFGATSIFGALKALRREGVPVPDDLLNRFDGRQGYWSSGAPAPEGPQ